MRSKLSFFLCMITSLASAQPGSTCETAIDAGADGFVFPVNPAGSKTWYKFTARSPKAHLDIPAGNSFVLYEHEGDDFCGSLNGEPKKQKLLAKRNITSESTGFELPSYSEEVLNGKCDCNSCTGGKFNEDIPLRPDAQYYLLLIGEGKGVRFGFIPPPVKTTAPGNDTKPMDDKTKQQNVPGKVPLKPLDKLAIGETTVIDVHFEDGKSALDPGSDKALKILLDFMNKNPKVKIELQGHVDGGSKKSNVASGMQLSEARAKAVRDYLVAKGISKDRLSYKGFGSTKMVYFGNIENFVKHNRRVEVMLTAK